MSPRLDLVRSAVWGLLVCLSIIIWSVGLSAVAVLISKGFV
jgi:hypothetical protein